MSIDQQYLDIKKEMQSHFDVMEKESKIEMAAFKIIIALLFCTLVILV
jgi:hypothetical protein